ncbi:hypothetical protein AAH994_03665 [Weeksellaceae bacterium A-14]
MLTKENHLTVIQYLKNKKLPLDLLVEVEDHMVEQLNYKIETEEKPFYLAWIEVQQSWNKDLKMVLSFNINRKITRFQKEITGKTSKLLWKQTLKISLFPLFFTFILLFYNKLWASYWLLFIYGFLYAVLLLYALFNFKIIHSGSQIRKRNISYLQNAVTNLTLCLIFIPNFVFVNFWERFEKLYQACVHIIQLEASGWEWFTAVAYFSFFILGIFGLLSFRECKKQMEFLKQKINFKL